VLNRRRQVPQVTQVAKVPPRRAFASTAFAVTRSLAGEAISSAFE